ncbi:uncharacterized protein LOC110841378 isoform X2 [Zootermopsis nevadensis]|nr:uncharacterized protein LOC110841378 isoform X2 [Zootermopsis nevadensis]XP_021942586.1 uncharacterized protein LOC110841378 isoform X2 [Zootermopsis nevadensis]XP_021942592.1 uncharacterized protein LOC110841378 isoform X2 [Zootermopsis nevadensis]XP_021942600.1 uncharacterized protein LOC110841378 isoform X2 [Zootermopsis nevadensis]
MQSIGLTVDEISMVYLALPLTTFLSPPITGYLIDKFGQYKFVMVLSLILNAAFHHSLLLIPHMETPGEMPSAYVTKHPETGQFEVWWSPCPSRECPEEEELDMILADCMDHCLLADNPTLRTESKKQAIIAPTAITPPQVDTTSTIIVGNLACSMQQNTTPLVVKKDLHFLLEKVEKKKHKKRRKHGRKDGPATGIEPPRKGTKKAELMAAFFLIDMHQNLEKPPESLGIEMEPDDNGTSDFRQRFGEKLLREAGVNLTELEEEDLRCGGLLLATNLTYNTLKQLAEDCMLQKCSFREGGPEVCPPDYKESDDRTFWIYFFLRFVGTVMLSGGVTMLDPIALTMIQKYGGEFGRERLFSTIGMAIFSPLAGLLMDQSSSQLNYTDYSAAFYTYDILLGISAITILLMPLGVHLPADNIMRDLLRIVRLPPVLLFIFFLFVLGNFWGFIESFLFLYLKELGASNYLLGITVTVGSLSSIPFLYGAGKIMQRFGHVNIIIIAFFSHAARLMGYSFIENPWWCFPFEAIEALAVHLMWIAAATYCAVLAPKTLLATLIGVLGMAHFSLGRGSGSYVGGWLISVMGTRESFRLMGFLAIAGGVAYGLLHYFWLRKVELNGKDEDAAATTAECGEGDHLNSEAGDTGAPSIERLSLIIEMNHHRSLTSLHDSSCSVCPALEHRHHGSASKDVLQSELEVKHNIASNPQLNHNNSVGNSMKTGGELLIKKNAENSPKPGKFISISLPSEVWQNYHDYIQQVEIEEDKRLQENARQIARCLKEGDA